MMEVAKGDGAPPLGEKTADPNAAGRRVAHRQRLGSGSASPRKAEVTAPQAHLRRRQRTAVPDERLVMCPVGLSSRLIA